MSIWRVVVRIRVTPPDIAVVGLIVAVGAFESGVHSVHHLNANDGGILSSSERLVLDPQPNGETHSLPAHQGRAPPLPA
jgi:hypothetical protein